MIMESIVFIGGDMRVIYGGQKLSGKYDCYFLGFGGVKDILLPEPYEKADIAVLPLPTSKDGITINCPLAGANAAYDFYILEKAVKNGGVVFTSKSFPLLEEICRKNNFTLLNYFEREELTVMNAVPTAEGALEIAMKETETTLFGADILVTGFGRIAKILVKYLTALGAKVTAAARKPSDLALIRIAGANAVSFNDKAAFTDAVSKADIIMNTVPAPVFDGETLGKAKNSALYIELASVLGAKSEEDFMKSGVRLVIARSLPGKVAPKTSGEIIADTIENILIERRENNGA